MNAKNWTLLLAAPEERYAKCLDEATYRRRCSGGVHTKNARRMAVARNTLDDMQRIDGALVYSASDLNNYLACEHLTSLDRLVALGELERPEVDQPQAEVLRRLGEQHEQHYLERLAAQGVGIVTIPRPHGMSEIIEAAAATERAMRAGTPIIYQAAFYHEGWVGYADFLRRTEMPSDLGDYRYEVADTKLARHTEAYFILQLCYYSEHVARIQGAMPERMHVVLGDGREESFDVADFSAHYRAVKLRFEIHVSGGAATSPYPVSHCDLCPWQARCNAQLDAADHLSRVAGMRHSQVDRLNAAGIATLGELATQTAESRPSGIVSSTWWKLTTQASLQNDQRQAIAEGEPDPYRVLVLEADPEATTARGFALLPAPCAGDVFFDMEGDPFVAGGDRWFGATSGLEYLFGVHTIDGGFQGFWGCDRSTATTPLHFAAERRGFEAFIDYIVERRAAHPDLHIYHYGSYEQTAMKKLMERHRTREEEVHSLLREGCFVDLYRVVKQSIMIGQPRYGIKYLEPLYETRTRTGVKKGDDSIVAFERWLASRAAGAPEDDILADIEQYNRFDCESTLHLLQWLWSLREANPQAVGPAYDQPSASLAESTLDRRAEVTAMRARLFESLPTDFDPEQAKALPPTARIRWMLGEMLAFYDREAKPQWWAFHDACDAFSEDPRDVIERNSAAIGGLSVVADEAGILTLRFPPQQHKIKAGASVMDLASREDCGTVVAIDNDECLLEIRIKPGALVPAAIVEGPNTFMSASLVTTLLAIAEQTLQSDAVPEGPFADVLLGTAPRLIARDANQRIQPADPNGATILPLVHALDGSTLFIQGPPGSGKTQVAAELIVSLIAEGKTVGVAAPSHTAAHNLLDRIALEARLRSVTFAGRYKYNNKKDIYVPGPGVPDGYIVSKSTAKPDGSKLYAGTAWLFAGKNFIDAIDYLFVDEAGQIEQPKFVAMTRAARNVVLLGDPAQLSQVAHTTHPGDVGLSVLDYLLDGEATVPPERGVFLTKTHRMHRDICTFVSELSYRGRLHEAPSCNHQEIFSDGLRGAGLRAIAVAHEGNRVASREEAARIADEIGHLLAGELVGRDGVRRAIRPDDIIVVSPYNAQRILIDELLRARFGKGIEVGTVNKFQGREAYVVFYSMATSSGEEMPRSVEFLFERNRLNVAVSRARAMAVLVYSPALLEAATPSVDAMRLINGLDRFLELAH